MRHDALRPSDRLLVLFALYFADRSAPFVKILLGSQLRCEYQAPEELLKDRDMSAADAKDLQDVLKELVVAAAASAGAKAAIATAATPESFWDKCLRYVVALEAVRDAEEEGNRPVSGGTGPAAQKARDDIDDAVLDLLTRSENLGVVATELKALARTGGPGIDTEFYANAALMADVLVARRLLQDYVDEFRETEDPPAPPALVGQAPDAELTEADCTELMNAVGEKLEGDQKLFMDELPKYGTEHLPAWARKPGATPKKPDRFAKVITGFKWNRYNKAKFGGTNHPPPRTVLAYDFTLLYPDLEEQVVPKFEVVFTEKGPEDEYCILVFRAGPPYLDVAYRIVNKRWASRKGAVKSFIDPSGRFKLYFRFDSMSYRR